jgi:hypothetical protein
MWLPFKRLIWQNVLWSIKNNLFFLGLLTLKMGPIHFSETSVKDYHSTLRKVPEKRRSDQHGGGAWLHCFRLTSLHPKKGANLWTATREHKIHRTMMHACRVLHQNFSLLIKMFSLPGVPIILPFFRSPLLTLSVIVPRGCNKERRLSVTLFCFSQYYYNFNRIRILKRNPKSNCKNIFTTSVGVTLKINLG